MFRIFFDKVSAFQVLGLEAVGALLLGVSVVALLTPIFGSLELGGVKFPAVPENRRGPFMFAAGLLFMLSVGGSLPLISTPAGEPELQSAPADMMEVCQPIWQTNSMTKPTIAACSEAFQIRNDALKVAVDSAGDIPLPPAASIDMQLDLSNLDVTARRISEILNRATNYCFQAGADSFFADDDGCDFSRAGLKSTILEYHRLATKIEERLSRHGSQ